MFPRILSSFCRSLCWRCWPVAAALIVALAAAGCGRSPAQQGRTALQRAFQQQRPLPTRLACFAHAPYAVTRGNNAQASDSVALEEADTLMHAAYRRQDPAGRYGVATLYLTQDKLDQAVEQFAAAVAATPRDAALLNDYGTALMAQSASITSTDDAEAGHAVELLALALEQFNAALEVDPASLEARFNRALLYEKMYLPHPAREEWQHYLKQDSTSPWADEARQTLARLPDPQTETEYTNEQVLQHLREARGRGDEEQTWKWLTQYRDRVSSRAVNALLDEYLAALSNNDQTTATSVIAVLTDLGDLEIRKTGDRLTHDLAAYYRRWGPTRHTELRRARQLVKDATVSFDTMKVEEGKEPLLQARKLFLQLGNQGEAMQTAMLLTRCYTKESELKFRAEIYDWVSRVSAKANYQELLIQNFAGRSYVQSVLGDNSGVIELSRQGIELALAQFNYDSAAGFALDTASAYWGMGNYSKCLASYFEGLRLANLAASKPLTRWSLQMIIAEPLNKLQRHEAAVTYLQQSLRIAQQMKHPKRISLSYMHLGQTFSLQGKPAAAIEQAKLSLALARSAPAGSSRANLLLLATLSAGHLYSELGDYTKAAENFDEAIDLSKDRLDQQAYEYFARKGSVVAQLEQGSLLSLEEKIRCTLDLYERYRDKIQEENNRNSFVDVEQSIYDIAVDFWYTQKADVCTAFELAERNRARSLLEMLTAAPRTLEEAAQAKPRSQAPLPVLTLAEVEARMPIGAQLLQYAVLKDRLLLWLISPGRPLIVQEQSIKADEVTKKVADFLTLARTRPSKLTTEQLALLEQAERNLYELLLAPVAAHLDSRKQLCIAADKILHQLPFGALRVPSSGHFLVEDFTLLSVPSATTFILCSENAVAKMRVRKVSDERLVAVGNPAFDRQRYPTLADLGETTRDEAQSIARFYPRPQVLIDDEATKAALLRSIGQCDVLHLALHCLVEKHSPMNSKLLLAKASNPAAAPRPESDSVLQTHEIYRLPLPQLRLVILSACQSGVERYYGGEGMIGVARPFLAQGVPLVVASLWEVDSRATSELMKDLHWQRTAGGLPTAEALKRAQLNLLRSTNTQYHQPYYWAGFEGIGGYTSF